MPFASSGEWTGILDRSGRNERVHLERGAPRARELVPDLPVRAVGVDGEQRHERRERLVQPQAVPPAHGDQVAEPHVRELMGHGLGDVELLAVRRRGGIDEQRGLAVGDAAQVLHGALREVGQRDVVDLLVRVRDAVVVGEPRERVRADLQRERRERMLARHVGDPRGHPAGVDGLGQLQVTHDERHEVRGHGHRVREHDPHPAVVEGGPFDLRTVRQRRQIGGDDQRHAEDRLQVGLVPRRERPSSVGGLEVGGGDDLGAVVGALVRRPVEPDQLVVQLAAEVEVQRPLPRRRITVQRQVCPLGVGVEPDRIDLDPPAVSRLQGATNDLEIDGVEDDLRDRLGDRDGDVLAARERTRRQVRRQHQLVATGRDGSRQAVTSFGVLGRHLRSPSPFTGHGEESYSRGRQAT